MDREISRYGRRVALINARGFERRLSQRVCDRSRLLEGSGKTGDQKLEVSRPVAIVVGVFRGKLRGTALSRRQQQFVFRITLGMGWVALYKRSDLVSVILRASVARNPPLEPLRRTSRIRRQQAKNLQIVSGGRNQCFVANAAKRVEFVVQPLCYITVVSCVTSDGANWNGAKQERGELPKPM